MKTRIDHNPEQTLSPKDRRKRARHMSRIVATPNELTRRMIKRLPNRDSKSGQRKQERLLRRYAKAGYVA